VLVLSQQGTTDIFYFASLNNNERYQLQRKNDAGEDFPFHCSRNIYW